MEGELGNEIPVWKTLQIRFPRSGSKSFMKLSPMNRTPYWCCAKVIVGYGVELQSKVYKPHSGLETLEKGKPTLPRFPQGNCLGQLDWELLSPWAN
nr:hypothetical protein Itr_chr12CG11070 [Ipomoea trifida]